ncbi:glutamate-rich protein 2 [Sphaerodactylus townsendi]|uniref:glutamate-rich protein 2 n=1 Tax=Sphaerodactylus townsendi TaxID=933632 RepID=UPI00202707AB|nr:glutamate-rich protein 2 [Sphaerodactylus townsendi]
MATPWLSAVLLERQECRELGETQARLLTRGQVLAAGPRHEQVHIVVGQGGISKLASPFKVSGMLEVIAPEDGFNLEKCEPLSRHNGLGRTDAMKEQKNWQNGRLHVFGPNEDVVIEPVQTAPRIRCGKESRSRPYTPSKQILLRTAKSLGKQTALARSSQNQNAKAAVKLHKSIQEEAETDHDPQLKGNLHKLNHGTGITGPKTESKGEKEETSKNEEKSPNGEVRTDTQVTEVDKQSANEKPLDSSDSDECNDESSDGEAEKRTAPLELMGEFLKAIMQHDYRLAKKLCQMILIYEPHNPEAEQFLPLIERKMQLESEQEAVEEETDEESTDDSEEDTSDTEESGEEMEATSEDSDA